MQTRAPHRPNATKPQASAARYTSGFSATSVCLVAWLFAESSKKPAAASQL
ncbi:hypothetical protein IWQ48_003246 [Labrenzia sp. EL_13]|nr:hypothetical protein [Labrenzia sp. EL_195]MBG6202103.1 hypothetical protein [Labrenzia sp. EL_13]